MTSALKAASAARRKANRARGKARDYERVRARAILPNTRVMITRRCHDRRMYLSAYGDPKKGHTAEETANFYGFTIARAVKKYGVSFHGGIRPPKTPTQGCFCGGTAGGPMANRMAHGRARLRRALPARPESRGFFLRRTWSTPCSV